MEMENTLIGEQVVRSKGDYVVGRVGIVLATDLEKRRAQVKWTREALKTWVSFDSLEPTSIPYTITEGYWKTKHKYSNPKYSKK